ncbi:MAG: hypothetical protein JWO02_3804 [Solirubrobacterales bacterium]|nr:hypothetical protein [Solirubrobacterales bacterium]
MPSSRWLGVGHADTSGPDAGVRATDQALVGDDAKLLVVFASESHDLSAMVRQISARSGGVPLIGCTTAGEIATSGPGDAGVVVTALGGDGFSVATTVATGLSHDLRVAGAHAADCLGSIEDRAHRVLLLLTDGLAGDQQEIVRGAYGVLGAGVPIVGGCAGDELRMTRTSQLYGDRVLTDAVVAAAIGSDAPLGIGVRHGWRKVGEPMLVTRSGGNRVYTLDDRPALDVYLERLAAPAPARASQEELARLALTHPLGLGRRDGEEHVRFVGGGDFADRSLSCIADVPQGGLVWIMEGDAASMLEATDAACSDSLASFEGRSPLGMLAFDCIARRGVLGDDGIRKEIDRVALSAAGAPVAGFYTYGEIARTHGLSGFHNQTLVVLSIG